MRHLPLHHRLFLFLGCLLSLPLLLLVVLELTPPTALWLMVPLLALAYGLAVWVARPLAELVETARRLRAGDLRARALVLPDTEWTEVAMTMVDLATQLEVVTQNLEAQVHERTLALQRKADQLRAVGQVGQQVAAVLEPDILQTFVVKVMRGTFGYDVAAILQRHGEHLVLAAGAARDVEEVPAGRLWPLHGPGAPPLAACVLEGRASLGAPSALVSGLAAACELAVPLRLGDRVLGVLAVQSLHPAAFDQEDRSTLETIAGQVAVALENARLFAAERQLRDLSIAEERNRMAREIHDTLAQGFMGILMQLRAMQRAADPESLAFHRQQAEALAQESLQEARRSVWNLRPRPLEGQGLAGALQDEVQRVCMRAGIAASCAAAEDLPPLSPTAEAALLRIAQEALHNVVKHAQARAVEATLTVREERVELVVADDGVGFMPSVRPAGDGSAGGFGLRGMAERAAQLGGGLTIESMPGEGCRVHAWLPLADAGQEA